MAAANEILNFSFDVDFKDEKDYKRCLEEIFRFIYALKRQAVACYRVNNTKIKLLVKITHYTVDYNDTREPAESFELYLKIDGISKKLNISNIKGWQNVEMWKDIGDTIIEEGGCLIFWLGCCFPFEFCEKLKMTICSMSASVFKDTVEKYAL